LWPGLDMDYALLHDLVARRRVKTLLLQVPDVLQPPQVNPHPDSRYFLPYGDDPAMYEGLSLRYGMMLGAESVLGAPRHLVSILRGEPDAESQLSATLGADPTDMGFDRAPYLPVFRASPSVPGARLLYSTAT